MALRRVLALRPEVAAALFAAGLTLRRDVVRSLIREDVLPIVEPVKVLFSLVSPWGRPGFLAAVGSFCLLVISSLCVSVITQRGHWLAAVTIIELAATVQTRGRSF